VTHAISTDPQGDDTGQKAQFPIQEILWHAKQTDRSYIKQHNMGNLDLWTLRGLPFSIPVRGLVLGLSPLSPGKRFDWPHQQMKAGSGADLEPGHEIDGLLRLSPTTSTQQPERYAVCAVLCGHRAGGLCRRGGVV
jgi:hypothetical protein